MKQHKQIRWILGGVAGLFNGLFAAGGGLAIVPMLSKMGMDPRKAHATAIAIMMPLSIITAIYYWIHQVKLPDHLLYWLLPSGMVGSWLGAQFLEKINARVLKFIFGGLMIYAGIRIIVI